MQRSISPITFEEALAKLKSGSRLELQFRLCGMLVSRHELSFDDGKITDFSYVDDSTTTYTISQYKRGFYGKAFREKTVTLEEEYT